MSDIGFCFVFLIAFHFCSKDAFTFEIKYTFILQRQCTFIYSSILKDEFSMTTSLNYGLLASGMKHCDFIN